MTTPAPPCALVTAVTKATTAGKPAYPVCTHWSWRGGRCPPSEPPASRAAAGAPGGPGAPPPDPRTDALLAERRTVVVAARIARADQAASGPAEALQLPNVGERANEVVSGLGARWLDAFVRIEDHAAAGGVTGRRLHPPGGGFMAFPQGSIAPQARAGSDPEPETTGVTSAAFPGRRSSDRRGVAPSPTLRPKGGEWIRQHATETQRGQRVSRTVTSEGYAHKYEHKGGLTYVRTNVAPRVTPARANYSRESGRCRAFPGSTGGPLMLAGCAPLPGRTTRSGRRGTPARPLRGDGRPHGGAAGRRSKVLHVPFAAPPSAARGPGPAALRTVSAAPMCGSRRMLGFPPRRGHLGTRGPSRRPPSAGCADQRSAQSSRWGLPCGRHYLAPSAFRVYAFS